MLNKWMRPLGFAMMLSGCQTSPPTRRLFRRTPRPWPCAGLAMMMQTTLWFDLPSSAGAAPVAVC